MPCYGLPEATYPRCNVHLEGLEGGARALVRPGRVLVLLLLLPLGPERLPPAREHERRGQSPLVRHARRGRQEPPAHRPAASLGAIEPRRHRTAGALEHVAAQGRRLLKRSQRSGPVVHGGDLGTHEGERCKQSLERAPDRPHTGICRAPRLDARGPHPRERIIAPGRHNKARDQLPGARRVRMRRQARRGGEQVRSEPPPEEMGPPPRPPLLR
mmetsp:Transcript_37945/g.119766  ORF Transcript_37945/g.119766 Transcript_37945/m.119766 type:complete len:214 (-) Transcript_37945:3440-4081(-)